MMKQWKAAQEKKYILSKAQVKKYFAFLENALERQPCDHTLRHTEKWLAGHYKGGKIDDIIEEIKEMGGYFARFLAKNHPAHKAVNGATVISPKEPVIV